MTKKNKIIFIAGQDGFLGKALSKNLSAQGYRILSCPKNIDLTNLANALRVTRKADLIINAAGLVTSRVDQLKRPAEIFYANSLIQFQLLEAAAKNNIDHFISISSITAYPQEAPSPIKEIWLTKNIHPDIEKGASYYALSKWLAAPSLKAYAQQYDFKTTLIVFPNLYGPEDKFNHSVPPLIPNLIKNIHKALKTNQKSFSAGSGPGKHIELLHVDDASDFIVQVIKKPPLGFQCINAGYGRSVTLKKVCNLINRTILFRGIITWNDSEKSTPRCLSASLSRKLYNWHPSINLEKGISETVSWYLNHVKKSKT
jgi:GDP-L-fucose synthase